jgi:hypothetical protein
MIRNGEAPLARSRSAGAPFRFLCHWIDWIYAPGLMSGLRQRFPGQVGGPGTAARGII